MRDDQIHRLHEISARRSMLLLNQFEFLNTRQLAFEQVLSTRLAMLKALWNPAWLKRAVDIRQNELLGEAKRQREAAMAKPVIKPVMATGNGNGRN